jgi:hypothetical protein
MFVPLNTKANDVSILKLLKNKPNSQALAESESLGDKNQSLGIKGLSDNGDVMFTYENKNQNLTQTFGISLKYYKPHLQ